MYFIINFDCAKYSLSKWCVLLNLFFPGRWKGISYQRYTVPAFESAELSLSCKFRRSDNIDTVVESPPKCLQEILRLGSKTARPVPKLQKHICRAFVPVTGKAVLKQKSRFPRSAVKGVCPSGVVVWLWLQIFPCQINIVGVCFVTGGTA